MLGGGYQRVILLAKDTSLLEVVPFSFAVCRFATVESVLLICGSHPAGAPTGLMAIRALPGGRYLPRACLRMVRTYVCSGLLTHPRRSLGIFARKRYRGEFSV